MTIEEKVIDIIIGMRGIGGIPTDSEYLGELIDRLQAQVDSGKTFIVISGNSYFEGEKYITACAESMGVWGFFKQNAIRMTADEAQKVCDEYSDCIAIAL